MKVSAWLNETSAVPRIQHRRTVFTAAVVSLIAGAVITVVTGLFTSVFGLIGSSYSVRQTRVDTADSRQYATIQQRHTDDVDYLDKAVQFDALFLRLKALKAGDSAGLKKLAGDWGTQLNALDSLRPAVDVRGSSKVIPAANHVYDDLANWSGQLWAGRLVDFSSCQPKYAAAMAILVKDVRADFPTS